MYATHPPRRWTVQEVYDLPPDGNRYEVVHGELLVTPSPATPHQMVVARLTLALGEYLKRVGLTDALLIGPVDYFFGTEVYVQPDIVVVYREEITTDWHTMKRLRLAVEVVSPSSARGDRVVKRQAYQEAGVETYWVVDPERALVEVWLPGTDEARVVADELVWRVTPSAPELQLIVPSLFRDLPT